MTIKHHLPDSLLMAYSAGQLPEAFNLVVATHVSMCDECRIALGAFDAVGGALVAANDCAAVSDGLLEATLAQIGVNNRSAMMCLRAGRVSFRLRLPTMSAAMCRP